MENKNGNYCIIFYPCLVSSTVDDSSGCKFQYDPYIDPNPIVSIIPI